MQMLNSTHIKTTDLRYQRAYGLSVEALHTLCCATGSLKERLLKIDLEFFMLNAVQLPDSIELRSTFQNLRDLVTSKEARNPLEGRIKASLDQLHHTKLQAIAKLVWKFHKEFLAFLLRDAQSTE